MVNKLFFLLLPCLALAKIEINADSMQGDLKTKTFSLKLVTISNEVWQINAKQAKSDHEYLYLLGNVKIINKKHGASYLGEKFRYSYKQHIITAQSSVTIKQQAITATTKSLNINLNTNKIKVGKLLLDVKH